MDLVNSPLESLLLEILLMMLLFVFPFFSASVPCLLDEVELTSILTKGLALEIEDTADPHLEGGKALAAPGSLSLESVEVSVWKNDILAAVSDAPLEEVYLEEEVRESGESLLLMLVILLRLAVFAVLVIASVLLDNSVLIGGLVACRLQNWLLRQRDAIGGSVCDFLETALSLF